jgi:hypothetical protein
VTATDATMWRGCRCGAKIEPAPSGAYWVDSEGWDTCIGAEDSHEPAENPACLPPVLRDVTSRFPGAQPPPTA